MAACPLAHAIRAAVDADLAFILDPWLQELRHAPESRGVNDAIYFPEKRAFIGRLLQRSRTLVARNPDDFAHLYGFICFEPQWIHWVYVKDAFRKIGLGRALIEAAQATGLQRLMCTQASAGFLRSSAYPHFVYNPYVHYRGSNERSQSEQASAPARF